MHADPVADYLAEVGERLQKAGLTGWGNAHTGRDLARLLAAAKAALAGHRRSLLPATLTEDRGKHYCLDCTPWSNHQTIYAVWPCPRYQDITAALLDEEEPAADDTYPGGIGDPHNIASLTAGKILCAHADRDGEGSHWLNPGERCPLAELRDADG